LYRCYLAGGAPSFRLPASGAWAVFAVGLLVRLLGLSAARPDVRQWLDLPLAAAAAVLVAAFMAHWLGTRRGLLAGLAVALSPWSFQAAPLLDRLAVETLWIGVAAFALANVPGRLPRVDACWVRPVFWTALAASWAVTGFVGPCYLLTICSLYLIAAQDSRGGRFLLDVRGLAFLALVIAALVTARHFGFAAWLPDTVAGLEGPTLNTLVQTLAVACLPWLPLALPGLAIVLREGHCFLPFWRLLACWAVVPSVLVVGGLFRAQSHLDVLLPPLALLAALGVDDGWHRLRRLGWVRRRAL
jgi:hypothetical protein